MAMAAAGPTALIVLGVFVGVVIIGGIAIAIYSKVSERNETRYHARAVNRSVDISVGDADVQAELIRTLVVEVELLREENAELRGMREEMRLMRAEMAVLRTAVVH